MTNQTKQESLARWVAEKVGDTCPNCGGKGYTVVSVAAHGCDSYGDGSEEMCAQICPVQEVSQEQCQCEEGYFLRGKHVTPTEYLNCKNVAGRLLDYAIGEMNELYDVDTNDCGGALMPDTTEDAKCVEAALQVFTFRAWQDTPAAIEELAKACGWTAPIIDNDTEKIT